MLLAHPMGERDYSLPPTDSADLEEELALPHREKGEAMLSESRPLLRAQVGAMQDLPRAELSTGLCHS